jgi:hypothetical protein
MRFQVPVARVFPLFGISHACVLALPRSTARLWFHADCRRMNDMMKPQAHLTTSLKLGVRSGLKWKTLPSDLLQSQVQHPSVPVLAGEAFVRSFLLYLLHHFVLLHRTIYDQQVWKTYFFFFFWMNPPENASPSLCYSLTHAHSSIGYRNRNPQPLTESDARLMYLRVYDNRVSSRQPAPSPSLCFFLTHTHNTLPTPTLLTITCTQLLCLLERLTWPTVSCCVTTSTRLTVCLPAQPSVCEAF